MILENKLPVKYILRQVKIELIVVLTVGLITNFLATRFRMVLPDMPLSIPAFLGTAISILLSFKMNQSYDRWWEARKVWGAIVNDSRSFVVQLQAFLKADHGPQIKTLAYRQIAWCYALGQALRGLIPLQGLEEYLSQPDQNQVATHLNKPLAILQLNARDLKNLRANQHLDSYNHVHLDATLTRLTDAMGKAERINNTVFPATYRQFLHFVIYLFLVTLSVALKEVKMIFELPLLLLISTSFFLIEKSAYHLQDPFRNRPSDVPVTAIARTIEINIRQLLGETRVPDPIRPNDFYIL